MEVQPYLGKCTETFDLSVPWGIYTEGRIQKSGWGVQNRDIEESVIQKITDLQ